ncbi:uncharacterized protein LOC132057991 [Lycium ferocissimum]|uniref:uncharacterized protein LOC132057991 n=1 Tax=Lycium ferocissimum TaxID=112874 RepID=UPI002814B628|nr:uncharacterized protein LOC132057991 [Lycium ferocissimum]
MKRKSSTVIPFDLSKLLNKDGSLFRVLLSATLQFDPQDIPDLANDISDKLFTKFQDSQALLPAPRPTYVIAIRISQTRFANFDANVDLDAFPKLRTLPPPIPFYRRFEIQKVFTEPNVSAADYMNDPNDTYTDNVVEYLNMLREYTGEGGVFPTKPPIATDIARGFVEVKPCQSSWCASPAIRLEDLMDDTCPVCQDEFRNENEVIATYCAHAFHTRCLLPWLSKKNSCPTCRAVYPLHYSPSLDRQCRKRNHNMLEAEG